MSARMIDLCRGDAGMPEPEFAEVTGAFVVTFQKDILTEHHLRALGLSERQIHAVMWTKEKGSITNTEYQHVCGVSMRTASRDLAELVQEGVFGQRGTTGRGTRYALKDAIKTPNTP